MREIQHRLLLKFIKYFDILPLLYSLRRVRYLSPADTKLLFVPKRRFRFAGQTRHYLLHVSPAKPKRIVLALHAVRDTARLFAYYSSLHNVVDEHTLVVYPEATQSWYRDQGWNAKICCGPAMEKGIDDVGFLAALVRALRVTYGSTLPVYFVGFSNGGMLAQYFAATYPELCAGLVSIAASCGSCRDTIKPTELPFPVYLVHGEQDRHIPFAGGVSPFNSYGPWASFQATVQHWYAAAREQTNLVHAEILEGLDHVWPGWRLSEPEQLVNRGGKLVWDFLLRCERIKI